jgi:hypothetical protein
MTDKLWLEVVLKYAENESRFRIVVFWRSVGNHEDTIATLSLYARGNSDHTYLSHFKLEESGQRTMTNMHDASGYFVVV